MTRHEQWRKWYEEERKKPYFLDIWDKMSAMDKTALLSPEKHLWLKALEFPDFSKIKVVMVSSYPHPDTYSADGYAFSSIDEPDYETGVLHRRLESELGITFDTEDNSKQRWADQGVLLLPMELTVINGNRNRNDVIWRPFTTRVLRYFIEDEQRRAFVFLDRYSYFIPELFQDKAERPHLYINADIRWPEFHTTPIFKPIQKFIAANYSSNIDWR